MVTNVADVINPQDYTTIGAALNAASGKVLDGGGATYAINAQTTVTAENITVQNITFDCSAATAGHMLRFVGTEGTALSLSSDVSVGDYTLTVTDTSTLSVDQWCFLKSDDEFASSEGGFLGQYVCIKSKTSTTVTLHNDLLYAFATADNAELIPITPKKNITFKNVNFIGADNSTSEYGGQVGLAFDKCKDVTVDNCKFEGFDYTCVRIEQTVNFSSSNCTMRNLNDYENGTEYGYGINGGSYGVTITNAYGEDLRHLVTIGGTSGVNLFINVTNCHVSACRDAGIDAHAHADFVNFSGNTLEGSQADSGQLDGIIFQGLNAIINDNVLTGMRRFGIFHQLTASMSHTKGAKASVVISGNSINNQGGQAGIDVAIAVQNIGTTAGSSLATYEGVAISNNTIRGVQDRGIRVWAIQTNIKNVTITGNVVENSLESACTLQASSSAASGYDINSATICNNIFKTTTTGGTEAVHLYGYDSTSNVINAIVANNLLSVENTAGRGVRLDNGDHILVTGNILRGATDVLYQPSGDGSTNVSESNNL